MKSPGIKVTCKRTYHVCGKNVCEGRVSILRNGLGSVTGKSRDQNVLQLPEISDAQIFVLARHQVPGRLSGTQV